MRPIWQGGISFGLVYVPVKLYSATQVVALDFDLLSKKDLAPIRYARVNKATGEEVPWTEIVKGYQYQKGDYVVLHDEDFAQANVKKTKSIEILDFVSREEIDPIYFEKPYYLEPDQNARKTYALLCQALAKTDKVAVAKFVLRNREHLAVLEPEDDMLMLTQMRFKQEFRPVKQLDLPQDEHLPRKELAMAVDLIEKMSEPFRIEKFKDEYVEDLKQIIKDKVQHQQHHASTAALPKPTRITDLMQQLKASLQKMHPAAE